MIKKKTFNDNELYGRETFVKNSNPQKIKRIQPTDIYCEHDIDFTGVSGNKVVVEIKCRDLTTNCKMYKDGILAAKNKIDHLLKELENGADDAYFVFYLSDGYSATFHITQNLISKQDIVFQRVPKQTANLTKEEREMTYKPFYKLKEEDAIVKKYIPLTEEEFNEKKYKNYD